ncbi:MAG: energy transducer TonB [Bacteroidia bacterium]|nr:energy transducer TonB [Bacteroidia bacterium]
MKTKLFLAGLLVLFFSVTQAQTVTSTDNTGAAAELTADDSPEFPGGIVAMMEYVKANIKYPQRALDAKISGKCAVKFIVNPDGSLSDVTVLDGIKACPECDAEAVRVIQSMPKWKPGKIAGKQVSLYYNLPVKFSLPKN